MVEFSNPSYFPPGSGGLTHGVPIANLSARLALTAAQARGRIVTQESDGSSWVLRENGTPATPGDWLAISPAAAISYGIPENGVPASVTLNPAGENNSIDFTADQPGTAGHAFTVGISIDSTTDRTQLTATAAGSALLIASGDKRIMRVGGSLTFNGDPVTFPDLVFNGIVNGKPSFLAGSYRIESSVALSGSWVIIPPGGGTGNNCWAGSSSAAFPDDVATWTPIGAVAGTASVSAAAATAAQAIAAFNAAAFGVTAAANGADTGSIAALAPAALTGGHDSSSGILRITDEKLYAKGPDGTWREAALSSLA